MKELDILLLRFLDRAGPGLSLVEWAAFDRILDLPDPQLARHLLADDSPADPGLAPLLDRIRSTPF